MIKIFKPENAKVREVAKSYKIFNFLTRDDSGSLSVAVGKAEKNYEKTMNTASDRAYYIISGEMTLKW